jgi:glycosyltransferase involved in cell wall biosynthesis
LNLTSKLSLYQSFHSIGFVAPSHWIADKAKKSLIGSFPISTIPNPIASEFLEIPRSTIHRNPGGRLRVGFVAANVLDPVKGFSEVSGVLMEAQARGLIDITTAGRISSSGQKKYPSFNHTGVLSKAKMIEFYDQLDVVVVPSMQEAAGMVPLEAIARGVVPIVRATGGLEESISEECGYLFRNARELSLVLSSLTHSSLVEKRSKGPLITNRRSPKFIAAKYLEFGASLSANSSANRI